MACSDWDKFRSKAAVPCPSDVDTPFFDIQKENTDEYGWNPARSKFSQKLETGLSNFDFTQDTLAIRYEK